MDAVTAPAAIERVLTGLAQRRARLVRQVVSESTAFAGYGSLEAAQAEDFAATVGEGLDAVLLAMAEQRSFADDDVAFLWSHIRKRTQAGVSEADMLAVVRVFQRTIWDAIVELAGEGEDGREAALILARPLIGYIDVFSQVVNAAFAEAEEVISASASAVRGELMDVLLSGGELTPGPQLTLARRTGLDFTRSLAVIVARTVPPIADEATLGIAAVTLARAMGEAIEPLAVVRGGEVVVVRSTAEPEAHNLTEALRTVWWRLQERSMELAVGVSTVHDGLADVPTAYREACLVVEQLPERGGVLGLADLGVADYLLVRAGDGTAWRLVPPAVRSFVEDDARQGGVLCETLLAYVACDLNVKLAAEQLFVHPNTAHYRLARIEERTGCSVRSLADVLLLTIAIRLERRR